MIYYQFDPEMDGEFLNTISKKGFLPESVKDSRFGLKDNEEAYVFSNDEEQTGFLWLAVHEKHTLEIVCLYMEEFSHSIMFQKKLLDFAMKRAKYLGLENLQFNRSIYDVERSQLKMELGCSVVEIDDGAITCFF